jgi:DNA invertase Pin-like site-specific DNA recombinase
MAVIVGYLRVSTKGQGESGLGLEGQKAAIENYARQTGSKIAGLYTEVESGKVAERPQLARAISHARRSKATLVVAKLDRLSRNVEFLARVMNSGTEFIACDNPAANRLTLHILSAVAEAEAKQISERTKAALAAYKARGGLLGGQLPQCRNNLTPAAIAKGREIAKESRALAATEAYSDLAPEMAKMRDSGMSLRDIAAKLTAAGHTTRSGKPWNQVQVARVLARCA